MQTIGQIKDSLANAKDEFTEGNIAQGRPATLLRAAWLNTIQREHLALLDGEVPQPNMDDQIYQRLRRKLPLLRPGSVRQKDTVHSGPAVYPDVLTGSGQLTVALQQAGKIIISTGQAFIWRGCWHVHTDDYSAKQRSFSLSASQTYHLRWQPFAGFVLCNLADGKYNLDRQHPSHVQFDTKVDDMLIAEVVTDSDLGIDVNHLKNRQELSASWDTGPLPINPTLEEDKPIASLPLNWARTPIVGFHGISNFNFARRGRFSLLGGVDDNNHVLGMDATRNGVDLILRSRLAVDDGVQFHLSLEA